MSKRLLIFLNVAVAFIIAVMGAAISTFLLVVLWLKTMEIADLFRWEMSFPSIGEVEVVYVASVANSSTRLINPGARKRRRL